jgi:Ca2+-transporting ATPase
MTVRAFCYQGERFEVSGEGYRPQGSIRAARNGSPLPELTPLLIPLVACNDSCVDEGRVIGDPMEAALLILADKGGIVRHQVAKRLPRLAEVPFDSAHKFMATFHREDDRVHVFVKVRPMSCWHAATVGSPGARIGCCMRT